MKLFEKIPNLLLVIIAGIFLWLSWPTVNLFFLSFVAFALIMIVEDRVPKKKWRFFLLVFVAMLIWNIGTTYWVFFATPFAILAWVLNALLMCIPWRIYRSVKRHHNLRLGILALIGSWLALEYLHFNWEVAWPWLALGNIFSTLPNFVQWYEFTGVGGGTLWILLFNILFFFLYKTPKRVKLILPTIIGLFLLPVLISIPLKNRVKDEGKQLNIVVAQPNFDNFNQDRSFNGQMKDLDVMVKIAEEYATPKTDLFVYPEGLLPSNVWKHNLTNDSKLNSIQNAIEKTGSTASIIVGADVLRLFKKNEKLTSTARYQKQSDFYYDVYNASIHLRNEQTPELYIKSKLVPGVERMPYPSVLKPLQKLAINLGGIGGSRATQPEPTNFSNNGVKYGTAICYESIFGDYTNEFVKKGANVLVVITNDGWWKNTVGHKHHLHYARLRAIETRRDLARSANTGISAFINAKGEILAKTKWEERTALAGTLTSRTTQTFYTKHGDFIYRIGALIAIILTLITIVKTKTKNFKYRV